MAKKTNPNVAQPRQRTFPGPEDARAALRVHFSRRTYADLTVHAKESLEAEVCGVLVGEVCEDDAGLWVDVRAIIRGNAAREARAHVTFTHETWNQIHTALDKDYPDFQIVGWYHTHPGFGVEFSAMDRFIQQNFFSAKTQVAFLTDPLGGDVSLCFNGDGGIEYVSRFWVDAREHQAKVPGGSEVVSASGATVVSGGGPDLRREVERLEARINQLINAYDQQRTDFYRMLTASLVIVCVVILGFVGYQLYLSKVDRVEPPRGIGNYATIPVKIGDQTAYLGVEVVRWDFPPSLDARLDKIIRAELELRAEMEKEAEELKKKQQQQQQKQRAK
ncbi:MAG TPA: Mov34/MPN/PAD-1 family protein [Thermoanaerobaculia bacterium]|nr:Mov34/MPN/PAD-1 family protein [Thermoanaerobaculia bacterium]